MDGAKDRPGTTPSIPKVERRFESSRLENEVASSAYEPGPFLQRPRVGPFARLSEASRIHRSEKNAVREQLRLPVDDHVSVKHE